METEEKVSERSVLIELQLFPNIAYFLALCAAERIVFEAEEHYQKSSFRNRYYIASVHGHLRLSVPLLKGKHQQMPVREVMVDDRQNWRQLHWRSIQTAYGKSPFFEFYKDELYTSFHQKEPHLFSWSLNNIRMLIKWLGLDIEWSLSESYIPEKCGSDIDLRNVILPEGSDNLSLMAASFEYEQVFSAKKGFQQNLSILDLLFCLGPEAGAKIKSFVRAQKIRMDRSGDA